MRMRIKRVVRGVSSIVLASETVLFKRSKRGSNVLCSVDNERFPADQTIHVGRPFGAILFGQPETAMRVFGPFIGREEERFIVLEEEGA